MNILEYAIKMEKEGEAYYRKQAEISKNSSLKKVCLLLADEEKSHAAILENKMNSKKYTLEKSEIVSQTENIFSDLENMKSEIKEVPSQLDFYRFVLENEQKSIDLYEGFLSESTKDDEKELFSFLIGEEKNHYALVDELVKLLTNAEQWVESAEFGIREDY
ncbi:MAG: ferritin family protein [Clostridia bacterium]|nr:ferritin family protein [Clostridia bacterium]